MSKLTTGKLYHIQYQNASKFLKSLYNEVALINRETITEQHGASVQSITTSVNADGRFWLSTNSCWYQLLQPGAALRVHKHK